MSAAPTDGEAPGLPAERSRVQPASTANERDQDTPPIDIATAPWHDYALGLRARLILAASLEIPEDDPLWRQLAEDLVTWHPGHLAEFLADVAQPLLDEYREVVSDPWDGSDIEAAERLVAYAEHDPYRTPGWERLTYAKGGE